MLSNEEVLEMVIHGYEQLKMIAEERGMTVDDLIIKLRECMCKKGKENGFANGLACVKIKEIRELSEVELEEENSRFFPIPREQRRLNIGVVKIKIK